MVREESEPCPTGGTFLPGYRRSPKVGVERTTEEGMGGSVKRGKGSFMVTR